MDHFDELDFAKTLGNQATDESLAITQNCESSHFLVQPLKREMWFFRPRIQKTKRELPLPPTKDSKTPELR